jgi:preprotein translocase subunit SecA
MAGLDSERNMRSKTITRSVETEQKRVEGNNFDSRKHLLQYDDVMGKHREIMYAKRNEILDNENVHDIVIDTIKDHISGLIRRHTNEHGVVIEKDCNEIVEYANENLLKNSNLKLSEILNKELNEIIDIIETKVLKEYEEKIKELPEEIKNDFEKAISLRVIDSYWMEHINTMDHLREGVSLRGYANEDPLQAYIRDGFELFDIMLDNISRDITIYLLKAEIRQNLEVKQVKGSTNSGSEKANAGKKSKKSVKVGRNEPCPCGSGKKYKNCCGRNQ